MAKPAMIAAAINFAHVRIWQNRASRHLNQQSRNNAGDNVAYVPAHPNSIMRETRLAKIWRRSSSQPTRLFAWQRSGRVMSAINKILRPPPRISAAIGCAQMAMPCARQLAKCRAREMARMKAAASWRQGSRAVAVTGNACYKITGMRIKCGVEISP